MPKVSEELFDLVGTLEQTASSYEDKSIKDPVERLGTEADKLKRSFSGSWLGYHSRVYYDNLEPAPPGANFSQEWGLKDMSYTSLGSRGDWCEFDPAEVKAYIYEQAGNPSLEEVHARETQAVEEFDRAKGEMLSIFEHILSKGADNFISKLKADLEGIEPLTKIQVASNWSPKGPVVTRDMVAMGQGNKVPPHVDVLAEVAAIRHNFGVCKAAADICKKGASHLERKERDQAAAERVGTNVFIGHGRSPAWRELKDFVQDRLGLPFDEFNRVPVAGVTNIARLSQMLDDAAIALVIMTAEDERVDGAMLARMNVIHEVGLFQGRLGFTKAIVLLEEGCEEFSNIAGLGQIRFPTNNIAAAFEEVRRVMEREGLIT
jgi:predicted nucleotide-binding protein